MKRQAYAKRTDENQKDIVDELRRIGCEVESLSGCKGMPDLLVALANRIFLLEVKNPETKGKPNDDQERFHKRFPVSVVRSIDEALKVVTKQS